jgi:hypothetical protein
MNVYIYECLVSLHGREAEMTHAMVYALTMTDAITQLAHTEGVLMHDAMPVAIFSQPVYVEPCVILERRSHS